MQIPRLACSGDINSAISYAFKTLGYDRPTLEQERAVREFVSGRDIFVISPTGSGKRVVSSCNRTSITSLCNYGYVLMIPRAAPSFESG